MGRRGHGVDSGARAAGLRSLARDVRAPGARPQRPAAKAAHLRRVQAERLEQGRVRIRVRAIDLDVRRQSAGLPAPKATRRGGSCSVTTQCVLPATCGDANTAPNSATPVSEWNMRASQPGSQSYLRTEQSSGKTRSGVASMDCTKARIKRVQLLRHAGRAS